MKNKTIKNKLLIFTVFSAIVLWTALNAGAQTTAFTYQGKLTDASMTANGSYDFQFILYDAASGGNLVASNLTATTGVTVSSGTFTAQLNFGAAAFPGADRYLEIQVKKPSETNYTILTPRQPITSAPNAIRSLNATNAANATNAVSATNATNAAQLGGVTAGNYVQTNTSALIRNQTTQQTADFNISGNGTAGGTLSSNIVSADTQFNITGNRVLINDGHSNLFAGFRSGSVSTGFYNSFFGSDAGGSNTTGGNNSFFGLQAGYQNTTGSNNNFFGFNAGNFNTTGSNNTALGYGADFSARNLTYSTVIGSGAFSSNSNSVVLGRSADTVRIPGNLIVTGSIAKGSGSFRIDHPLDPANKYLYHSFVESPDMMNIYNGNATTDGKGEATIVLPDYFEALNRDFRYQLTVIGQFAQAVVAEEIKSNLFKIKTDKPNVKVSWQITGVRHDKFAEDHPIPTVEEKPSDERGKCVYEAACPNIKSNF